jgi:23S rRNA pseudouridine955/2504/2580 synthase
MIRILRESPSLLIALKPAGMSVQPGEKAGRCLIDVLSEELGYRPFLLHRLDRDTEGVIALAKDREAASRWSKALEARSARKLYAAVVAGRLPEKAGRISDDILTRGERQKAVTEYRVCGEWESGGRAFSLLELELGTGRMHQIRIHLAGRSCPILGDDKHGDWKLNKEAARGLGVKKLMLFARSLSLGEWPEATVAPWPGHFLDFFQAVGADPDSILSEGERA